MNLTKPYCGVQHLLYPVPGVRQITATNHGEWSDVWALGLHGFTEFWKAEFPTIEEALAAGEKKAIQLSR